MPLLAQPDRAVKLFDMACTGCPIPTGNSSHGLRNNGPVEKEKRKRILYVSNAAVCAGFRCQVSHDADFYINDI